MSDSLFITHTLTHWGARVREKLLGQERDYYCQEIIFMFLDFDFGVDSISEEVVGTRERLLLSGDHLTVLGF